MLSILDKFLDSTTMYRLVLYVLLFLLGVAIVLGFFHILSYSPIAILFSATILTITCWVANKCLAYLFKVPANVESVYITALILTLIITPTIKMDDMPFLIGAGVLAMASKYVVTIKKKHLFNPAAIAVVLTGFIFHRYASWWVGTEMMLPFVIIGGYLVVKKVQRWSMVTSFLLIATLGAVGFGLQNGTPIIDSIRALFLDSAVVFFATIMLTEPLTTPYVRNVQIIYAAVVGFLYAPQIHIGPIYSTPELTLLIGNIFSYIVSPKQKLMLKLKEKKEAGNGIGEYIFSPSEKLHFIAGQYMEWTLQHPSTDSRGNRRYFTLASSPTEENPQLGIRFYPNGSSFKNALQKMKTGDMISAGQLAGEFTLPKNTNQKVVLLAGGIGITPFRSMIKYLVDTNTKMDVILLYVNKLEMDIRYKDVFEEAEKVGVRTIYVLTEETPKNWKGLLGRVTPEIMKKEIPDFSERLFYLSGSHISVKAFEEVLQQLHLPSRQIKKDFFPGFV